MGAKFHISGTKDRTVATPETIAFFGHKETLNPTGLALTLTGESTQAVRQAGLQTQDINGASNTGIPTLQGQGGQVTVGTRSPAISAPLFVANQQTKATSTFTTVAFLGSNDVAPFGIAGVVQGGTSQVLRGFRINTNEPGIGAGGHLNLQDVGIPTSSLQNNSVTMQISSGRNYTQASSAFGNTLYIGTVDTSNAAVAWMPDIRLQPALMHNTVSGFVQTDTAKSFKLRCISNAGGTLNGYGCQITVVRIK